MIYFLTSLFALLMGHAIADFGLQSDAMAKGKNRNRPVDMSIVPPGQKYQVTWFYWLTAHSLIHGAAVGIVTGSFIYALVETVMHWLIDFGKCESWYGIHEDQVAHFLCKVVYATCLVLQSHIGSTQ